MKIDTNTVKQIAQLARLRLNEEECEKFAGQFAEIVSFVEQLSEVDTSGVDTIHVHDREDNVIFKDQALPGFSKEESMANAPEKDSDYFLVPKVISGEEEK